MTKFEKSLAWFALAVVSILTAVISLSQAPFWFLFLLLGINGAYLSIKKWSRYVDELAIEEKEREQNGGNPS